MDSDEDAVEGTGEVTSSVVVENKLAANKLAANKLQLNNVGANDLLATDEGREVLSFIVSCAIKEGNTLVAEHDGVTYEFFGEVGLANKWLDHPIDDAGVGWVSACLFARVNASNVPIPISLRGPNNKLAASPEEKAGWTLQEGAFYGNFFTEEGEDIDWNACQGSDQVAGETGGLVERDCAEPDGNTGLTKCGFKYTGICESACKKFEVNGTFYKKCSAPVEDDNSYDHENGHTKDTTYDEVITVYVTP